MSSPRGFYDALAFSTEPGCQSSITYSNEVTTAQSNFAFIDGQGSGKVLGWETQDVLDIGEYVVRIYADAMCMD